MNASTTVKPGLAIEPAPLSKTISRLSLLMAVVASQAYLIHAIFFAHVLTPISVYVIDRQTHLHLLSGQIGSTEEVFHWDGLTSTMLISVLVFVVGWMAARGTARLLSPTRRSLVGGSPGQPYSLPSSAVSDIATVPTGGSQ
jgi:hypothetical protein